MKISHLLADEKDIDRNSSIILRGEKNDFLKTLYRESYKEYKLYNDLNFVKEIGEENFSYFNYFLANELPMPCLTDGRGIVFFNFLKKQKNQGKIFEKTTRITNNFFKFMHNVISIYVFFQSNSLINIYSFSKNLVSMAGGVDYRKRLCLNDGDISFQYISKISFYCRKNRNKTIANVDFNFIFKKIGYANYEKYSKSFHDEKDGGEVFNLKIIISDRYAKSALAFNPYNKNFSKELVKLMGKVSIL